MPVIKIYVAALDLPEKATMLRFIAYMSGPKRLQLQMLRKADADNFSQA